MGIDARQLMIVYQNALGHATQIAIHNAKHEAVTVEVETVIEIAKKIAAEVIRVGTKQ